MFKMKNIFSLAILTSFILFSSQSLSAQSLKQNQDRPEVVANNELQILTNELDLNDIQRRTLFRALVTKEVSLRKSELDENKASMETDQKKANDDFDSQMKKTLDPDQYKKWNYKKVVPFFISYPSERLSGRM